MLFVTCPPNSSGSLLSLYGTNGFPDGSAVKNLPPNGGDRRDMGLILVWKDPVEERMATQSSCLENPMDRGAWWATVCRLAKSQTRLRDWACTWYLCSFSMQLICCYSVAKLIISNNCLLIISFPHLDSKLYQGRHGDCCFCSSWFLQHLNIMPGAQLFVAE